VSSAIAHSTSEMNQQQKNGSTDTIARRLMIRESWAIQTNCAECDTVSQLKGGLCHGCRVSMGYEIEEA